MPLLKLQTSAPIADDKKSALLAALSAAAAKLLGKPESYMMVIVEGGVPMLLGGADDPAAFFEVRSVGTISGDQAKALSKNLGEIVAGQLGVDAGRIYSNYAGVPGGMWGYNGSTFG